jgi:putative ABC transport system permease protein
VRRFYRLLLGVYPRWFRERYEAELLDAFAAERRRPEYAGAAGTLRFWIDTAADLLTSAYRTRSFARRRLGLHPPKRSVMEAIGQDLRHACRQLLRRPGFSAVAVLSLALGIGGNAIIIAFVDGFVFHPFPYPEPDRLVTVGSTFPRMSSEERFVEAISVPEFVDLEQARTIRSIAAFDIGNRNISGGDRPERVMTGLAVTDPFGPFNLPPLIGRGFTADELAPGAPDVAILSHRLWQGRFGGDPSIVGRIVRVNGRPTAVVGVMPQELLVLGIDLWIPLGVDRSAMPRNARQFTLIGRLAPDATLREANAELAAIAARTTAAHVASFEEYEGWRLSATPWAMALMRDIRPGMQLLLGAVGLVLLIACANLSNLLLARSTTRQHEMAVRLALGAGRTKIARQLLAEVSILAAAGGGVGLLLALVGLPAVVSLVPAELNTIGVTASINGRVLAWAAFFTIGSAVLVALLPVMQSTRTNPQQALRTEGRRTTAARSTLGLRHALIVAEIALSVILLMGAGLLVRSFVNVRAVEPGFDPRDVLTMRITLPPEKYRGMGAVNDFFQQLIDRLDETPGVAAVSVASQFPPQGPFSTAFRIEGSAPPTGTMPTTLITAASAGHFATLGVPLVAGRGFSAQDRAEAPRVALVNQAFASRFFPGVTPIGNRLRIGAPDRPSPPIEIVGIVANTQNRGMTNPPSPEVFVPLQQQMLNNQLFLLVRAERDAGAMLPVVRQQLAMQDPEQPIYAIQTMEQAIAAATFRNEFPMILFGVFAAVALMLAAIGIYGVMSYAVNARTQEIGVRLAVGADRRDVIWLVLRQVLRLTVVGLAIGLAGSLAAGGAIRRVLFEVQPTDPLTIAAVVFALGSLAVFAGWLPAYRASRVDPVQALRYE